MTQHTRKIDLRINEIDRLMRELEAELAMLLKFSGALQYGEHLIRDEDTFSTRAALKFELLARVARHLSEPDPFMYGGASTKEIYNAVLEDLESEKRQIAYSRVDPDRREDGVPPEKDTPMSMEETPLNYNTFRSYLTRFKDEGRIFYNPEIRRWRLTKQEIASSKANDDDEDEDEKRDRHAE